MDINDVSLTSFFTNVRKLCKVQFHPLNGYRRVEPYICAGFYNLHFLLMFHTMEKCDISPLDFISVSKCILRIWRLICLFVVVFFYQGVMRALLSICNGTIFTFILVTTFWKSFQIVDIEGWEATWLHEVFLFNGIVFKIAWSESALKVFSCGPCSLLQFIEDSTMWELHSHSGTLMATIN